MKYNLYAESCLDTISAMKEQGVVVDLTVTSPPYDHLRRYHGYTFPYADVIHSLYDITRDGGIVVWVVGDATVDGDETGTSFKQALEFQVAGFKRWDTMIWLKSNPMPSDGRHKRYTNAFEYMFVFVKGDQPRTCNKIMVPTIRTDERPQTYPARRENGLRSTDRISRPDTLVKDERPRTNVWVYPTCDAGDAFAKQHPATYPLELAADHIRTWSSPGDIVYDPCLGSGTTAVAALLNDRAFIGSDISDEYVALALERIKAQVQAPLFTEVGI